MMIIMQFAFQVILLAVGFGVGYWLIITANLQQGSLKTVGQTLGGILIVMAMILESFSCYYSMQIANRGYMQGGCPTQRMMQQNGAQDLEEPQDQNPQIINLQGRNQKENSHENENSPIKRSINDHE